MASGHCNPMEQTDGLRSAKRKVARLPVRAFGTGAALEKWIGQQPMDAPGIWVRLRKKREGFQPVSQQDMIDSSLCHGSIDGQGLGYDESSSGTSDSKEAAQPVVAGQPRTCHGAYAG